MTQHCCKEIGIILDIQPKKGLNLFESGNTIMLYDEKFDEYGIIVHDGGKSYITIKYCPWCANKLPLSKREEWYNNLIDLGIEEPFIDEIPEEYRSNKWWKDKIKDKD